jgi:hypothetical protein
MPSHPRSISAKEKKWTQILTDWKESGQSAAAFCRERHLSESMFWFWKREIPRRRLSARSRRAGAGSPAVRLVPVRIVREVAPKSSPIELVLGNGGTVRLTAGFDPAALRELLSFFEDKP